MGLFEDIAVTDMKLRLVLVVAVVIFISVTLLASLLLKSELAFFLGVVTSMIAATMSGKLLFTD